MISFNFGGRVAIHPGEALYYIGYSRTLEGAKTEANKIILEAQAAIETQKMSAMIDVKNQVGKLVIEVSEKVLRKELGSKEAQEAHIKGLVDGVKLN